MELFYGMSDRLAQSLWVRKKGEVFKGDIVVGVCYIAPDQCEVDKVFFKQIKEVSRLQTLVLMGDVNPPDICWKGNTVGQKRSRRFLEGIGDVEKEECVQDEEGQNFSVQVPWLPKGEKSHE